MLELNKIHLGDCLELMKEIPDKSIDMILCDLPYGTTKLKWDSIIPFDKLWEQYERIIKGNGAIVLFGTEPFSSKLRASNLTLFKYDWYWRKSKPVGFANAKKMPLKEVETISVFYKKLPTYNPQNIVKINRVNNNSTKTQKGNNLSALNGGSFKTNSYVQEYTNYPRQVLEFGVEGKPLHNTQKPIALLEYLIKTYTNEGDVVLDNCIGSGTTAVACINTKRNFIGIEKEEKYYNIADERINNLK